MKWPDDYDGRIEIECPQCVAVVSTDSALNRDIVRESTGDMMRWTGVRCFYCNASFTLTAHQTEP